VGIHLLHRDKVAQSFLKVAGNYGDVFRTAEQRQELQQLHEGIAAVLEGPMLLHDLDELEPQDDRGADPALDDADAESDYGDFDEEISERLMQEFERELDRGRELERGTKLKVHQARQWQQQRAAI
jgi:hypothetical protein